VTTFDYYQSNADDYAERFSGIDMTDLYEPFLERLPERARILDAGCGPGRDARAFARLGHIVTAFDAAPAMVELARKHFDGPVHELRFDEVAWESEFDGVWAMASLLHVQRSELPAVIERLARTVVPEGAFFMSFKRGDGDRIKEGREFTDYEEVSLRALVDEINQLRVARIWSTEDMLSSERQGWVNCIALREANA